jgi:hypothetical protein
MREAFFIIQHVAPAELKTPSCLQTELNFSARTAHRKHSFSIATCVFLGFSRDRYLVSSLARWLLRSTDHIENTFTLLLRATYMGTCLLSLCLTLL